jgi:glycosyltransferase involved in cell wall biosynthesis
LVCDQFEVADEAAKRRRSRGARENLGRNVSGRDVRSAGCGVPHVAQRSRSEVIPMRIAQIAPLAESVPPKLYGGTERVVGWLVDELVDLGHQVTLFASGDSTTRAKLHPVWPRALRLGRPRTDPNLACALLLEAISRRAEEFDVIHSHIDWLHLPMLTRLGIPFVTTMHGRLDLPGIPEALREFPEASFVSISDNQRAPVKEANWCGTVYHGLPAGQFRPSYAAGSYLAFLGRLTPDKGPEDAIRIARAAGMPLRIAAKVPRG